MDIDLADGMVVKKTKVKSVIKPPETIYFEEVVGGALAICSYPSNPMTLRNAKAEGATGIVTLVTGEEGAVYIQRLAAIVGLPWSNYPFHYSGVDLDMAYFPVVRRAVNNITDRIKQGERILIHCFEGIHRSGLVTLATLLNLGLDPVEALTTLYGIRRTSYWRLPADAVVLAHELNGHHIDWKTLNLKGKV